jgi:hypothetical protein
VPIFIRPPSRGQETSLATKGGSACCDHNLFKAPWCFEDERTPATTALLVQVGESGAQAPGLWLLEALNGLLVAERRGRLDASRRHRLTGFLRALPIKLDDETASQVCGPRPCA